MKIEGHCMRCGCARVLSDWALVTMKNGRCAARGKCAECGTTVYKILSRDCEEEIKRETE